jgi:2-C-methyl-D-erythritol 4-phosphate cytidylyltransferase
MPTLAVILPAAGRSLRFGSQRSKLLHELAGLPVIRRSVAAFLDRADVAQVVIACNDEPALAGALGPLASDRRLHVAPGGPSRAHSVLAALRVVEKSIDFVAVHDAARPLVSQELIDRTLTAAARYGAAVPALPVALTIRQATAPLPAQSRGTVPRHDLWAMQTPQIVRREHLLSAFNSCQLPLEQITDDVQLIELAGGSAWLVDGEERNLKITTPLDLRIAELLLQS